MSTTRSVKTTPVKTTSGTKVGVLTPLTSDGPRPAKRHRHRTSLVIASLLVFPGLTFLLGNATGMAVAMMTRRSRGKKDASRQALTAGPAPAALTPDGPAPARDPQRPRSGR